MYMVLSLAKNSSKLPEKQLITKLTRLQNMYFAQQNMYSYTAFHIQLGIGQGYKNLPPSVKHF